MKSKILLLKYLFKRHFAFKIEIISSLNHFLLFISWLKYLKLPKTELFDLKFVNNRIPDIPMIFFSTNSVSKLNVTNRRSHST